MFDPTILIWIGIGSATLSLAFLDYWFSFKKRIKLSNNYYQNLELAMKVRVGNYENGLTKPSRFIEK